MNGLFSPDSRFMRYMNRLADLMLLNLMFLLTSIPIVTIGASLTALYSVCFRLGTVREGGTVRDYFRAFRENFGEATKLWLLALLLGGAVGNFIDRLLFGFVTDMFATTFMNFPVFNVADIGVVVGGVLLCIHVIFTYSKEPKPEEKP